MITAARPLPALGWDPCPGDVAGSRALAEELRSLARRVRDGEADARADAPAWRGPAAREHRARIEALPVSLRLVAGSVDELAAVVEGWATTLGRLQVRADEVERQMRSAKEQVTDASGALALAARASAPRDVLVGRPAGWTAHVDGHARVERATAAQAAAEAAARRLHEEYADAADEVVRALAAAVDVGMRAPWSGAPLPGLAAADGGFAAPLRPAGTVLRRSVGQDWYGEGVRRHAEEIDAYADGSAAAAVGLELVPLVPFQAASRGAGATSALATAQLHHVVGEDPVAALGQVGAAGTVVVGGAALRAGARTTARPTTVLDATSGAVTSGLPPSAPDAWEVPGHLATARRDGAEVAARAAEQQRTAAARRRADEVRRCTGG